MIKLSGSQVLVIESRRKDKWSSGYKGFPGLPDGFYGVVVYKVDTTAKPLYGVEEPDGANWKDSSPAYAYYIRNLDVAGVVGVQCHAQDQLALCIQRQHITRLVVTYAKGDGRPAECHLTIAGA
jgi:hypothetical protein